MVIALLKAHQVEGAPQRAAARRVLVVDDNEDNRDLLVRRLSRRGFEAVAAPDGATALRLLDRSVFDLVLLDVMMPGMNGIEVLGRIRATRNKAELPVIMATAKSESEDMVAALDAGANDYVTKPIDFPVLMARLNSQLATRAHAAAEKHEVLEMSDGLPSELVIDGRYQIMDLLGEGGFAAVYRAKQLSTDQVVALKYAKPERMMNDRNQTELQRFRREMKLIGRLRHPNIVRLIDSGTLMVRRVTAPVEDQASAGPISQEKTVVEPAAKKREVSGPRPSSKRRAPAGTVKVPYIVMEFLEGESMAEYLRRERNISVAKTVDLLLPVLSALGSAHEQGVIHRDIKPDNILLVRTGMEGKAELEPRVLDFGIAKLVQKDSTSLTGEENFVGTPAYMAPEQGLGRKDIDGRADQFSVAAIAYRALCGVGLYKAGSFFEMMQSVAETRFARPAELGVVLPPDFEGVMLKALSRERTDRYDSIDAFARALLPFASKRVRRRWADHFQALGAPSTAPSPSRSEPPDPEATVEMDRGDEHGVGMSSDAAVVANRNASTIPPASRASKQNRSGRISLGNIEDDPLAATLAAAQPAPMASDGVDKPVRNASAQRATTRSRSMTLMVALVVVVLIVAARLYWV